MFCSRCTGFGKIVGNGMIMIDCVKCKGTGDYYDAPAEQSADKITMKIVDKRSKAYKDAIKEIMQLNPDITHEKAHELFANTFEKV